jgi:hypothetical protein
MKQKKELQLREAIGRVLECDWDPVGVHESASERWDEYQSYVSGVLRLVAGDASEEKIVDHLAQIERVSMALSLGNEERRTVAARKLRGLVADAEPSSA